MLKSLRAIVGGLSSQDQASVRRFDTLFYPGEEFTTDTGKLLAALKDAQAKAELSPLIVPEPLVCGNSTTGPPCLPLRQVSAPAQARHWTPSLERPKFFQKQGTDRRKVILLVSDGANELKLNHHS